MRGVRVGLLVVVGASLLLDAVVGMRSNGQVAEVVDEGFESTREQDIRRIAEQGAAKFVVRRRKIWEQFRRDSG